MTKDNSGNREGPLSGGLVAPPFTYLGKLLPRVQLVEDGGGHGPYALEGLLSGGSDLLLGQQKAVPACGVTRESLRYFTGPSVSLKG